MNLLSFLFLKFYFNGHLLAYGLHHWHTSGRLFESNRKWKCLKVVCYFYYMFIVWRTLGASAKIGAFESYDTTFKFIRIFLGGEIAFTISLATASIGAFVISCDLFIRRVELRHNIFKTHYDVANWKLIFPESDKNESWLKRVSSFQLMNLANLRTSGEKLALCPNMSEQLRTKLALHRYLFDIFALATLLFVDLNAGPALLYGFYVFVTDNESFNDKPVYAYPMAFTDMLSVFILTRTIVIFVLLIIFIAWTTITLYICRVREMCPPLESWAQGNVLIKKTRFYKQILKDFLHEHTGMCRRFTLDNRLLYANMSLLGLLCNFPVSIFFMSRLIMNFRRMGLFTRWIYIIAASIHFLSSGFPFWQVSAYVSELHRPRKFIFKLIELNKTMIGYKLKYLTFFERLNTKKHRYGLKMLGQTVTHAYCIELLFLYIAYLLNGLSL